jgi:GABA permease
MRRYLVVANQTLRAAALRDEISKRVEKEPSTFYLLVPNTIAAHYGGVPAAGGILPMPSMVTNYGRPGSDVEASKLARERLDRTLAELAESKVPVDGGLGSSRPLEAISTAVAEHEFDEIIIATLPRRLSRWLKADLPHQAERRFGLPVTTIITKEGPE